MSQDIADFLRARYAEAQQAEVGERTVRPDGPQEYTMVHDWEGGHVLIGKDGDPFRPRMSIEEFNERYTDPAPDPFVLADLDAKAALLADLLAERHHTNDGDDWFTCAAATQERDGGTTVDDARLGGPCDCGRDARVERRLRILVQPFAAHPDYKETWRP